MSVFSDNSPSDNGSTAWRRHLTALPAVDPPDVLWERLQAARGAAPARRSRWPWLATAAAVAATAALATVLGWPRIGPTPTPTPVQPSSGSGLALQPTLPSEARSDAGLRRLDDDLALAYAHDVDEAQIAALWEARARLIESLQGPTPALLARM